MEFREGDLLEAKDQYIALQSNCVRNRHANWNGLELKMFDRFPYADKSGIKYGKTFLFFFSMGLE